MIPDLCQRLRCFADITPDPVGNCARLLPTSRDLVREAADEIERLRRLLADKEYISWRARYDAGQLSFAGQIEEREKQAGSETPEAQR